MGQDDDSDLIMEQIAEHQQAFQARMAQQSQQRHESMIRVDVYLGVFLVVALIVFLIV